MKKKKEIIFGMMIMAVVLGLTACGGTDNSVEETEMVTGEPLPQPGENAIFEEAGEPEESGASGDAEPAKENLKSILSGTGNFICTDLGDKHLNIEEIGRAVTDDESITVSAEKFAVIDLDDDDEEEMILWLQINHVSDYGFEVLHAQDGEIYGYTLSYREFMNLKADGTFIFSGGAADFGIGKIIFSGMEYGINKQVYSSSEYDAENELAVRYFANGESCSADEFDTAMNSQEQKTDVKWYELSDANIDAVF